VADILIGYSRTSTTEQVAGLEAQKRALEAHGCQEIFCEHVSAVQKRTELDRLLRFIRKGDTLVITKLCRLARSVSDLLKIIEALEEREASLKILDMDLDTRSPTGRLLLHLIGAISEFERSLMIERQRDGISLAKSQGKYRGRAPTARSKSNQVYELDDRGFPAAQIADQLKISRASTYRILALRKSEKAS
jgi:DNA invertase Pin-like site-specific DNA recombinase